MEFAIDGATEIPGQGREPGVEALVGLMGGQAPHQVRHHGLQAAELAQDFGIGHMGSAHSIGGVASSWPFVPRPTN